MEIDTVTSICCLMPMQCVGVGQGLLVTGNLYHIVCISCGWLVY